MRRSILVLVLVIGPISTAFAQSPPLDAVEGDRIRIRARLAEVEAELRAASVAHLTPEQRAARAARLDDLRAYRLRGEFPHGHAGQPGPRVPTFIDRDGRACAMGQLIIDSGHRAVAEAIARDQNHARVPDITHPALLPWLEANGMTVAEATRVQPSYCWDTCADAGPPEPVCGSNGHAYESECLARCEGVTVVGAATCDDAGNCTCEQDGGVADAGSVEPDAGSTEPDAGSTEPSDDDAGLPLIDGGGGTVVPAGGGCSVGYGHGGGPLALVALLAGLAIARGRRWRAR